MDYFLYYFRVDFEALAASFEALRSAVFLDSGLDAAHYFGSPGLWMACFFKQTDARPDLLKDLATYEIFECDVRSGITFVNIHEATAHKKDVSKQEHLAYINIK